jgi:hypothetical protein
LPLILSMRGFYCHAREVVFRGIKYHLQCCIALQDALKDPFIDLSIAREWQEFQ